MERKIHHTTGSGEFCKQCGREFKFYWFDANEQNGYGETQYEGLCRDCVTRNQGRPPLGLRDLEEIRRRGITIEEYYKEQGY